MMCRSVKKKESVIVQTRLIFIGFSNQRWNVAMESLNSANLLLTFLGIRIPRSPPSSWHTDVLAWTRCVLPRCPRFPLGHWPVDAKSLLRRGLMPKFRQKKRGLVQEKISDIWLSTQTLVSWVKVLCLPLQPNPPSKYVAPLHLFN